MDNKVYLSMFAGINDPETKSKGFLEFLIYFIFFYGSYCILHKVWRFLGIIWVHMFRGCFTSKTKMFEKYGGEGSWALVTGGSDGIGL
jgi:hypothetical protein